MNEDSENYVIHVVFKCGVHRGYNFQDFETYSQALSDVLDTVEPPLWWVFTPASGRVLQEIYIRPADILVIEASHNHKLEV